MLRALRAAGKRLAVVSNKPDAAVKLLNEAYFAGLIPVAIGETPDRKRKPAPDTVLAALEALGAPRAGAVYVGDSEVDVETARIAELPLIAVSWGFRNREALARAGAEVIIGDPKELVRLCE